MENRTKFIEQKRAKRVLIQTNGDYKNKIDALFVDQRNKIRYSEAKSNFATLDSKHSSIESNGNYLVICCDGNASFYEVGIFQIPIERGFSTLGWNYPGICFKEKPTTYKPLKLKKLCNERICSKHWSTISGTIDSGR